MTELEQTLWNAAKTGKYSPGTTAQHLANVKNSSGITALHEAAWHGNYPPGTTAQDLANAKDKKGWSALHEVGISDHYQPNTTDVEDNKDLSALHSTYSQYPQGTTAQDLANAKDNDNRSALHVAAANRHLPPDTTTQDLANAKDNKGWSALHEAARNGNLPPDVTLSLLKTTKDNQGTSSWSNLCNHLQYTPHYALDLPPHLFEEDSELAITTVQEAIKTAPNLQNKAAIWLGKVIAGAQAQHTNYTTTQPAHDHYPPKITTPGHHHGLISHPKC